MEKRIWRDNHNQWVQVGYGAEEWRLKRERDTVNLTTKKKT